MKIKPIYLALLLSLSTPALANNIQGSSDFGVRGQVDYQQHKGQKDNIVLSKDINFYNSYISGYTNYNLRRDIKVSVDLGVGRHHDPMNDLETNHDLLHQINDFEVEINKILFDFKKDGYQIQLGRMFTPTGFFYNDPLNPNNFFNDTNTLSRYMDGANIAVEQNKNDVDLKVNGFIGTRLDDAPLSTVYGANLILGNKSFGHFNFHYSVFKLNGYVYLEIDPSVQSNEPSTMGATYFIQKPYFDFVVGYKIDSNEEIGEIKETSSKFSYKGINKIEPYVYAQHIVDTYGDKDGLWGGDLTTISVGTGTKVYINESVSIYGDFQYLDLEFKDSIGKDNTEDYFYRVGLNFNF